MPLKHTPIDERLADYVAAHHSGAGDPLIAELRAETVQVAGDLARMQVGEEQATLLGILAAATGAKRAIEIGTFTGASAIAVARAIAPEGTLLCCDVSREWTDVARRYWARAGVADRIELRIGSAIETLRALPPGAGFDFAFIDADKTGYDSYYEALLPRMRAGSLILFDNALQHGRVAKPDDENSQAISALNAKLTIDPRVECALLTVADGIMVCRKR
jgi:caffeoyl-CoA O-methyltransferase